MSNEPTADPNAFEMLTNLHTDQFLAVVDAIISALGYYNATVVPGQPLLTATRW